MDGATDGILDGKDEMEGLVDGFDEIVGCDDGFNDGASLCDDASATMKSDAVAVATLVAAATNPSVMVADTASGIWP